MLKLAFDKLFKLRENTARRHHRPGADDGFDPYEKPFLDHLEDLRHTLIKIVSTLAIATVAAFIFHPQIFALIQIPAKMPLANISEGVTLWDRLDLITLGPPEFIVLMLKLSFLTGVILTFPFTLFFLFQFILPGLKQIEKKAIIPGAMVGFFLFLIGAAFAFFLAVPVALKFFYVFENERISNLDPTQQALAKPIAEFTLLGPDGVVVPPLAKDGEEIESETKEAPDTALTPEIRQEIRDVLKNSFATVEASNFAFRYDDTRDRLVLMEAKGGKSVYRIGEYVNFIARLVLVFGISFQLPVVVTILVRLELLTARVMRATRTYAWIVILVAAAILTPPDILTLAMLGGPMILLYEICIVIATVVERKREKTILAEEEERARRMERLYSTPADELTDEEKEELHRKEIEQYEREHAHLYEDESSHGPSDDTVAREGFHGNDPYHDYDPHHDESWHSDHTESGDDPHQWNDGHPDDPNFHDHDSEGNRIVGSEIPEERPDSDHAEPEDLTPEVTERPSDAVNETPNDDAFHDDDVCAPSGPLVDVNHASVEELVDLPGVDEELANAIIERRPFETFDDLEAVPGFGSDKLYAMIDRLMLG